MASDFLDSNLCNPTAPSERFLKKTKWRKIKVDEGKCRKLNKKGPQSLQSSSNRVPSCAPGYGFQYNNNNNHIVRNNNRNRGPTGFSNNIHNGNNTNITISKNVKNDLIISNHITQPMLTSVLSDGLVRIPGPPNNPRHIRSSNLKSSFTSRRERVRRSVSQNLSPEANLFADTREVLFQDTQFQDPCIQTYSQDQLLQQHLKDPDGNLEFIDTSSNLNTFDPKHAGDMYINPTAVNISRHDQGDPIHKIITTNQEKDLIDDTKGDGFPQDIISVQKNEDLQQSQSNENAEKPSELNDKINVQQIQTDFDKMNLTHDENNKSSLINVILNRINQSLFRETLEDLATSPPKDKEAESQHYLHTTVDKPVPPNSVHFPTESTEETPNNNVNSKMTSSKRQQFLRLLHFLFNMRWKRNNKKEDKVFLVEEDIAEEDESRQDCPTKKKKKKMMKKRKSKQPLTEHKTNIMNKVTLKENKETRPKASSPAEKKKKRRLQKKNVYRAGRRIRKSLGYGCRYIGHGLANMTSIIPEVSYLGPVGHSRSFAAEYIHSTEYYDPNAPTWDYRRETCMTNHYS